MADGSVLRDRSILSQGVIETLRRCADGIGRVDVLTAGYPCQPFSTAARGRNVLARDLWPEALRFICEHRPRWCVLENVPGIRFEHIERACSHLETLGYAVWPIAIAVELQDHVRRRVWTIAHADSEGKPRCPVDAEVASLRTFAGLRRGEPDPMGMDDGLPERMDRMHALGNAIEPEIAEMLFRAITILSSTKASV